MKIISWVGYTGLDTEKDGAADMREQSNTHSFLERLN